LIDKCFAVISGLSVRFRDQKSDILKRIIVSLVPDLQGCISPQ
jgi:hypothetical protein